MLDTTMHDEAGTIWSADADLRLDHPGWTDPGAVAARPDKRGKGTADPLSQSSSPVEILRWHAGHGSKVSLTVAHTGFCRATIYAWLKRYEAEGARGLEERSRRPHRVRQRTWTEVLVNMVRKLRQRYPRWGKDKLAVLLWRQGVKVSVSMVGRILAFLKKKGLIREASLADPWMGARFQRRPYAIRKPRDYRPLDPGDLVEIDTADVRLLPGQVYKHFTARDVISRWDVLDVRYRATARLAADFLDLLGKRLPFAVRAIQVDGGSEFKAEFEAACKARGLRLFVLPPRSPKLNGHVERAQRTHKEEFYQLLDPPDSIEELRERLKAQEVCYNTVRPHQALGQLTPAEFYHRWRLTAGEEASV
jgi:transposase InsO family protein